MRLEQSYIFQQDSDPEHTAEATLHWFKKNQLKVLGMAQVLIRIVVGLEYINTHQNDWLGSTKCLISKAISQS